MALGVNFHTSRGINRTLTIKTSIQSNDYIDGHYPVVTLNVKENGINTSTVTLFMDFEQIADLQFELGKLLEEYTKK